ncbi:hypothetical protein ABK040_005060 [Willaertia magna]
MSQSNTNDDNRSEKEKMIAGEMYNAIDPELVKERLDVRRLIKKFNDEEEPSKRSELLQQIVGKHGTKSYIEPPFRCDYGYNISLGESFYANFGCVVLDVCPIQIGKNVMFGPNVQVYAATHPVDPIERNFSGKEYGKPIIIEDYVWIGGGVIINPGVKIGEGSTIGSGSVVTKDIPPYVVAAGNPCKVIKQLKQ